MDEIKKIDGIGAATAKKLAEAGFETPAALAAADPSAPLEGVSAEDWGKWIESAKQIAAKLQKTKTPLANDRVRFNGKLYEAKAQLPDLTAEEAAELRGLKIID